MDLKPAASTTDSKRLVEESSPSSHRLAPAAIIRAAWEPMATWAAGARYWNNRTQPPDGEFSSVSAGQNHTCGVMTDGAVACWGSDSDGETTPPGGEFISVSAGDDHTCGVRTDGSVACWGSNTSFGEFAGQATPPAGQFISVSAGYDHTCGIRADASVACWGDGYDGQDTPPEGGFVSVSVYGGTCAVRTDGSVACWGAGYGRLPLAVVGKTSGGDIHLRQHREYPLLRSEDGRFRRVLGLRSVSVNPTPPEGEFVSINAGEYHTCGIKADASVACWGSDYRLANPRRPSRRDLSGDGVRPRRKR